METKVLKVLPHEFQGSDGETVKGQYVYLLVIRANGSEETRRVFVSDDRMAEWAHIPKAGDVVYVFHREGKVVDMLPLSAKGARGGGTAASEDDALPFS